MAYTIYIHTNKINGKHYVGATVKTIEERWKLHIKDAKNPKKCFYFQKAINKYGKEFWDHKVLEICETIEEADLAEPKWIIYYKSDNPEFGYNIKPGGLITKPASEETKQKLKEVRKRRNDNSKFCNKERLLELAEKFNSYSDIAKYLGCSPENIRHLAEKYNINEQFYNKFYYFKWKNTSKNLSKEDIINAAKQYKSIKQMAIYFDCDINSISNIIDKLDIKEEIEKILYPFVKELRNKTKEELLKLAKSCNNINELADKLNSNIRSVDRYLKKYNIRDQLWEYDFKQKLLQASQICKTTKELRIFLNLPESENVGKIFRRFNISIDHITYKPHIIKMRNMTKEDYINLAKECENRTQMGNKLNTTISNINNYLKKHNLINEIDQYFINYEK